MRDIKVGVVAPAYVNVPLWVAQQRGFLERRGLRATERILGTTHGVTNALRAGAVDLALTAPEGSIADAMAGGPPYRPDGPDPVATAVDYSYL